MKGIDTTVLIEQARGSEAAHSVIKRLKATGGVATTEINSFEVFAGIYRGPPERARTMAIQFERLASRITVIPFGRQAAHRAGKIQAELAAQGQEVDRIDTLIAGTLLSAGITTIVTRNRKQFGRIPGLRVEEY